ncbi:hypothetical protein Hanom_Chr16g01515891 [Helianthus anomalus]
MIINHHMPMKKHQLQQPITAQLYTKLLDCFRPSMVHRGGPSRGTHEFTSINPAPLVLGPPITITRSPQPLNAIPQPFIESARSGNLPTVSHSFRCLSYFLTSISAQSAAYNSLSTTATNGGASVAGGALAAPPVFTGDMFGISLHSRVPKSNSSPQVNGFMSAPPIPPIT